MSKTIAIVGASYLQLPLVRKAREMGLQTICFAWEKGAVCKDEVDRFYPVSVTEKEEILRVCQDECIDGIASIASDVAMPTVNYVAARLGLTGNSVSSTAVCTDKYRMRERLSASGLRCPRFVLVEAGSDGCDETEYLAFPVIVKPCDRSGSRGVSRVADRSGIPGAVADALDSSMSGRAVVEEFVHGREISVETVSWGGTHYHLAITDKVTSGPPHFVELSHHQPSSLPAGVQDAILKDTALALDALEVYNGASHTEFLITEEGEPVVVEVGARMGGDFIGSHLVRLSTGYDFVRGVVETALGSFRQPAFSESMCSGTHFLSPLSRWVDAYIKNASEYAEIVESSELPGDGLDFRSSADRTGYIIYQSANRFPGEVSP